MEQYRHNGMKCPLGVPWHQGGPKVKDQMKADLVHNCYTY